MNFLKSKNYFKHQFSTKKICELILCFLDKLGFNELFRFINRKNLLILFYHGITEHNRFINIYHITKRSFESQIYYLKKKGYNFISLENWIKNSKTRKKMFKNCVFLTFDDGFQNVIKNAYPIMKKYSVIGCFYVVTELVGTDHLLWGDFLDLIIQKHKENSFYFVYKNQKYEYSLRTKELRKKTLDEIKYKLRRLNNSSRKSHLQQFSIANNIHNFEGVLNDYRIVTWDELKSLDKKILEIGCHSKTHTDLDMLENEEDYKEELLSSKIKLENEIGYNINHLSYPNGIYNEEIINYLKKYGFKTGVTVKRGFNNPDINVFELRRIMGIDDFILFKCKVSGLYYFLKKILILIKKWI